MPARPAYTQKKVDKREKGIPQSSATGSVHTILNGWCNGWCLLGLFESCHVGRRRAALDADGRLLSEYD